MSAHWRWPALAALGLLWSGAGVAAANPTRETLTRKRLSLPAEVQGYPCASGYTWFFEDGRLRECAVSQGIVFGEVRIPAGSWINLTHSGEPEFVFLAHDALVDGHICKGGGPLGPTEGAMTLLYRSGRLRGCFLAKDSVLDGVPCRRANFLAELFGGGSSETDFHESGRLKTCRLSRDFALGGRAFRRGNRIYVSAGGEVTIPERSEKLQSLRRTGEGNFR